MLTWMSARGIGTTRLASRGHCWEGDTQDCSPKGTMKGDGYRNRDFEGPPTVGWALELMEEHL